MTKPGVFVVLEGLDGSGTTTQVELLHQWFMGEGLQYGKCVSTCEPSLGPAGCIVRLALLHRIKLDSRAMALLFAADRMDHLYKADDGLQEPGLHHLIERGVHVVSDRYLLSSLAYQSLDLPMDWILQINAQALLPDLTIFLDIDPKVSLARLRQGRSHEDLFESADTQTQVRLQYEEAISLLLSKGQPISRVNGDQPADCVHRDIIEILLPLLDNKKHYA